MKNTNDKSNKSSATSSNATGFIAIIVVGIFVLCVIFLLARGLFTPNSATVPTEYTNTATINTDEPSMAEVTDTSSATDASTDVSGTDSQAVNSSESTADTTSSASEVLEVMYITEYAYLHTQPSNDAENIVCMSPGVEVNVLNYEDNGYVKVTFMNIDGQLTGYIYKDYLTSSYN